LTVAADSAYTVRGLSEAAAAEGVKLGVVVEVENRLESYRRNGARGG